MFSSFIYLVLNFRLTQHCPNQQDDYCRLDRAIRTLNFNANIKALNTQIMVCQKTNTRKLWSDSPTSGHVTDVCESMLKTEWSRSSEWLANRVSKFRWLVIHRLDDDDNLSDNSVGQTESPYRRSIRFAQTGGPFQHSISQ
jgi:hypothetical protein